MATIPGTLNTNLTDEQVLEAFDNALTHTPSDSTPKEDGSGSAGEAETFARSDHEHPHDTTKQDTLSFEGTYNASTNKAATMSAVKDGKLTGYAQASGDVAANDKIIEAIGKVEKKADDNKSNISKAEWTIIEGNYYCTASNVYEYTGVSVTCPANQVLEIIAVDRRGAANCTAISIADNDSDITGAETVIAENNAAYSSGIVDPWTRQVVCITPDTRNAVKTYYVWVKRTSTGQNGVRLAYRRIL